MWIPVAESIIFFLFSCASGNCWVQSLVETFLEGAMVRTPNDNGGIISFGTKLWTSAQKNKPHRLPCKGEFINYLRVRHVNGWVAHGLNLRKKYIDEFHELLISAVDIIAFKLFFFLSQKKIFLRVKWLCLEGFFLFFPQAEMIPVSNAASSTRYPSHSTWSTGSTLPAKKMGEAPRELHLQKCWVPAGLRVVSLTVHFKLHNTLLCLR